jgi:hypothetical protein
VFRVFTLNPSVLEIKQAMAGLYHAPVRRLNPIYIVVGCDGFSEAERGSHEAFRLQRTA